MKIIGTGLYAPGEPLTHEEVMAKTGLTFDTEKLEEKLGMKKRHIARLRGLDETTADFAEKASRCALEDAGLKPDDLDLFIVATDTPEFISPHKHASPGAFAGGREAERLLRCERQLLRFRLRLPNRQPPGGRLFPQDKGSGGGGLQHGRLFPLR